MFEHSRTITIFTPSCADENDANAQNLTVKEIVARLPPDRFHVTMSVEVEADPRIATRANTLLLPWTARGNAVRLLRHCIFSQPDIYFFPRCGPLDRAFFDFHKHLPCKTRLISYIVTTMDGRTINPLMRRSVYEAEVVCSNSTFVAATVKQEFDRESIVIHDGADHRFYFPSPFRSRNGLLRVLYAGSLRPLKRPELVIEQARRHPHVEFRIAGKGEMEEHCRHLCSQYRCGNVRFLGHLPSAQLGDEMRTADVFFFPSVLEGHPQVLIQATTCGLPIVAMDAYRPDCVVDGKTGFLAATDQDLSSRLDLLLDDAGLRQEMSSAAISHSRIFNWDRTAEKWANLFYQVAGRSQRLSLVESDVTNSLYV